MNFDNLDFDDPKVIAAFGPILDQLANKIAWSNVGHVENGVNDGARRRAILAQSVRTAANHIKSFSQKSIRPAEKNYTPRTH